MLTTNHRLFRTEYLSQCHLYISIKELPSFLFKIPPNLNINCPAKEVAAELAEGVFKGLILEQLLV